MRNSNFFRETQRFEVLIGDEISFIWASYSGLWRVYSEANKINEHFENINWKKAEKYLLGDIPHKGGIDLRRIAIRQTWKDHETQFEQMMLVQMSTLYEEWAARFSALVDPSLERIAETLQFPSTDPRKSLPKSHPKTWKAWLAEISGKSSELIKADYQPGLMTVYSSNIVHLDNLLLWFRFFKECRNAYVHNGGLYSENSVIAYAKAAPHGLKMIGLSRDISLDNAPVVNNPINLGIQNAFLGLAIISRLANGFDALLCHSAHSELDLLRRIDDVAMAKPGREIPSTKTNSVERRIKSLLKSAGLPFPSSYLATEKILKSKGLIKF